MHTTIPTPEELEKALLEARGICENDKKVFLHPEYSLGNVFDFTDMKGAVDRIYRAIKEKETIGIYADYDCDGIPGAVVLNDFFDRIGAGEQVVVYIPDRHDEGYGLSPRGIESMAESNVTVLITVDLGITGIAEVADANARGMDVIVTDHHAAIANGVADGEYEFPAAYAIIHPAKSTYQNTVPCGAAVAFYLVCAFLEIHGAEFGVPIGWEKWLLDLVGFATLSDMVPIGGAEGGENRVLAAYGLAVMRKTRRAGIQSLLLHNKVFMRTLTEQDLTFTMAPRLNAASRMDTPMLAFDLLRAKDFSEAEPIVRKLESINTERKALVARIVKEAHKVLELRELPAIVVIGNPDWRPAVLGLVATKLSETYSRSFFVWGNGGDDTIKGSCRMIETHHAAYLMQALPEGVLLHFGGHKAAGGFAVHKEHIHFLEQALNSALEAQHGETEGEEQEDAAKQAGLVLPLAAVTERHLATVRIFAPFGVGNPQPEFLFENVTIQSVKMFGKTKEHLELTISDTTGTATAFMFFAPGETCDRCTVGATFSFLGTLEAGFRGGARIRIKRVL